MIDGNRATLGRGEMQAREYRQMVGGDLGERPDMGADDGMLADVAEQNAVECEYRAPRRKAARRRSLLVELRNRPYRPAAPLPFVEIAEQDRRQRPARVQVAGDPRRLPTPLAHP